MTTDTRAKERAKIEAMSDEEIKAYTHARLHRGCHAEIDRLTAVLEVRTQSWMNTADALAESEHHFKIAIENLAEIEAERLASLDEAERLTSELALYRAVAEAALSVCSEDGIREQMSCYVMGVELLNRLDALSAFADPVLGDSDE